MADTPSRLLVVLVTYDPHKPECPFQVSVSTRGHTVRTEMAKNLPHPTAVALEAYRMADVVKAWPLTPVAQMARALAECANNNYENREQSYCATIKLED